MTLPERKDRPEGELTPFWHAGFGEMDRMFDSLKKDFARAFSGEFDTAPGRMLSTTCNIEDKGDKFVLTADMPRIKKEEIDLKVNDSSVEISANHKEDEEEKDKKFIRKEHSEFSFNRRFSLPERVKPDQTKAKLEHGILTVEIQKEQPTPSSKTTKVEIE